MPAEENERRPVIRAERKSFFQTYLSLPLLLLSFLILPLLLDKPIQQLTDYAYNSLLGQREAGEMSLKVPLIVNAQYEKSGTKSYVHLIRKYHINTTKAGPFFIGPKIHQTGKPGFAKPIGGRAFILHVLQKKVPPEHEGIPRSEPIDVDDVQNEYELLAQVCIGSPRQVARVGVDTALSDFWVSLDRSVF